MKVDLSDFKKGRFIKDETVNPSCDTYGPLKIMSVSTSIERFCTVWDDGWGRRPTEDDYINRQAVTILVKNKDGKNVKLGYWLDELTNKKSDFPNLVFLSSKKWEDAIKEAEKLTCSELLADKHVELLNGIRCVYGDIYKLTNVVGGEKNNRIRELTAELYELLKDK